MANIIGDQIVVNKTGTHYYLDGGEVTCRAYRRRHPVRDEAPTLVRNRRQTSVALAVHPDQVDEARADAVKRGVATDFTTDGRPVFESREHRKKYMRAYGYFDRDAGYGDAAPLHHKGDRRPPSRLMELAAALRHRIFRTHEGRPVVPVRHG